MKRPNRPWSGDYVWPSVAAAGRDLAAVEGTMPAPTSELHPDRARRAIGAMFLFAFGGAWLELHALGVFGMELCILAFIALVSVLLQFVAYRRYKQHQPALLAEAPSTQRQRAERVFNIVNASQWIVILLSRLSCPTLASRSGSSQPLFSL